MEKERERERDIEREQIKKILRHSCSFFSLVSIDEEENDSIFFPGTIKKRICLFNLNHLHGELNKSILLLNYVIII